MDIASPGYYSRLFLVPKPDGSFRPIIDWKKLNQFIVVPSFKMETLFSIIAALQPQEWITKIDLKDAYHHILVHVNIRKYFRFVVARVVYQFCVLPFWLSTAPREFTTLAPVVQLLRTQGIRVHAYLDDWIIRANSQEQSLEHTQQTIQLLQSLGWMINWDKSMLQPSHILDFLGLHFNLERAVISPPDSFLPTLTSVLSHLSPSTVMPAHKISSIISRMSHFAPFIHSVYIQYIQSVRVYCDNSTAVAYIRKQGGTHSQSLFYKTLELFDLLDQFVITLVPTHLPGARNVTADALSRISQPSPTEWRLPTETLHNLFCVLGTPLVDMFATAENRMTPVYVSPYPDDRAWAVDALSLSWDDLGLVYAFPPAPIVPKTLQKIQKSRGTTVIMIASQHPSRPWHPLLLQLSIRPRILPDVNLFQYVPNFRSPQYHRDPRLLDLATWKLSGTSWKATISPTLSSIWLRTPSGIPPIMYTTRIGKPWHFGPTPKAFFWVTFPMLL